jgi:UDP-glucuronate 4-epimerase
LAGKPITVFGDGSNSRDYTYVGDIVRGVEAALQYQSSGYEIINFGGRKAISVLDMVHTIERALGRKVFIDLQPARPGDAPHTCANPEKASRLLGWRATTSFDEGVEKFAQWLMEIDQESRLTV